MAQAGQQEQQHESVVEWALPLIDAEGVGGGGVPAGGTCAPAAGAGGADGGSTPDLVKAGGTGGQDGVSAPKSGAGEGMP